MNHDHFELNYCCRLARDYLFSAKNEGTPVSFLLSGEEVEAVALQIWRKVSKQLKVNAYSSVSEFLNDVEPLKSTLLSCDARSTKKRVKHIELVFRRLHDIASSQQPYREGSYSSGCNPCHRVVDSITSENVIDIVNSFHRSGEAAARQLRKNLKSTIKIEHVHDTHDSKSSNSLSGTTVTLLKNGSTNGTTSRGHPDYCGVREVTTTGGSDSDSEKTESRFFAYITKTAGRSRTATTFSVQLQAAGFSDPESAARVHDLASIRASGPMACSRHEGSPPVEGEDDSCLLNFDVAKYAEEEMSAFTQWDAVLLAGLSGVRSWRGVQPCDFSFLLFSRKDASSMVPPLIAKSPLLSRKRNEGTISDDSVQHDDGMASVEDPAVKRNRVSENDNCVTNITKKEVVTICEGIDQVKNGHVSNGSTISDSQGAVLLHQSSDMSPGVSIAVEKISDDHATETEVLQTHPQERDESIISVEMLSD
mmetsp:Transcript_11316/g.18427  ORF Transcript_11316/g.18427 Transcript_11316/m.18427 type:complete len:478 (-) Transcript_11316:182-1615(-)